MRTIRRRRREGKTDYKARINLLRSELPRVVFRKTNRYIIGQYIESKEAKDRVMIGVDSKQLARYGWPDAKSIKSIPACYLTGFMLGKEILERNGKKTLLDIGLIRNISKSKIYAFLKGVVDAGVEIPYNEKVFPDEARLQGKHLKTQVDVNKIKKEIENKNA